MCSRGRPRSVYFLHDVQGQRTLRYVAMRLPRSDSGGMCRLGRDRDLQDAVALIGEELITRLDVTEGKAVSYQRLEIRAAGGDDAHQPAHPLLAARAERRDALVIAQASRVEIGRATCRERVCQYV